MEALASFASWPRDLAGTAPDDEGARILYGQVWEDADVLIDALEVRRGHACLSIASAGDNVVALVSRGPARVIAIDRNPAQLFCLELRVAAYRSLTHPQVLELIGSRPSVRRGWLYARCRANISAEARRFWDTRPAAIESGIGSSGRFERYFALFRRWVLPLVHSKTHVARLLTSVAPEERQRFYDEEWNTWRWKLLFRAFFSRAVMGRLGRHPDAFTYVDGSVAAPILERTRHALTTLNPADNPYVHWILTGRHGDRLPYALRAEHFDAIRGNLDCLVWRHQSLRGFVDAHDGPPIDRCNLSDVFEYVALAEYHALLGRLARVCRAGARLAYWNVLADRTRPSSLAATVRPVPTLASALHARDQAFFYRRLVIEEVIRCS